MNVIPFPKARARTPAVSVLADWPTGQCGVELEALAQLIYQRGLDRGNGCTLEKARHAALTAFNEMSDEMELHRQLERERLGMVAGLLVDRAQADGVDLRIQAARAAAYRGHDSTISKLMAATHREAKARLASRRANAKGGAHE